MDTDQPVNRPPAQAAPGRRGLREHFVELRDREAIQPLYQCVVVALRCMIATDSYATGSPLPSLRGIAKRLDVSIATATRAYQALTEEGLIEVRPKSGHFLRPAATHHPSSPPESVSHAPDPPACQLPPSPEREEMAMHLQRLPIALIAAERMGPALLRLLAADWMSTTARAGHDEASASDEWLRRLSDRGFEPACEQAMWTPGLYESVGLALEATTRPDDTVAVSTPTEPGFSGLIKRLGREPLELHKDPTSGLELAPLLRALAEHPRLRALILSPNFDSVTGAFMPDDRRHELLSTAARYRVTVIECERSTELAHSAPPPPLLRVNAREARIVTCGSCTQILGPGARLGWLLVDNHLAPAIRALKHDRFGDAMLWPQRLLNELLRNGDWDRVTGDLRSAARMQVRGLACSVADSWPPGTRMTHPAGGWGTWLELAPDCPTAALLKQVPLDTPIQFVPGACFSRSGRYDRYFRVVPMTRWSQRSETLMRSLGEHLTDRVSKARRP